MPFQTDIDQIPESVPVRLPAGIWDEDELIQLKPYFDGFAQQAALVAGRHEVPDGTYADGKPKTKFSLDNAGYQRHLVFNHILDHSLRNAPTKAQAKAGKPGSKAKLTPANIAAALGAENLSFLLGLINDMSGEPPGGYLVKGPNGRPMSFREPDQLADRGDEEPVHPPEHDLGMERGAAG